MSVCDIHLEHPVEPVIYDLMHTLSVCILYRSMKQHGVSNDPVTFECHMYTYVLPCEHQKLSEIDG